MIKINIIYSAKCSFVNVNFVFFLLFLFFFYVVLALLFICIIYIFFEFGSNKICNSCSLQLKGVIVIKINIVYSIECWFVNVNFVFFFFFCFFLCDFSSFIYLYRIYIFWVWEFGILNSQIPNLVTVLHFYLYYLQHKRKSFCGWVCKKRFIVKQK